MFKLSRSLFKPKNIFEIEKLPKCTACKQEVSKKPEKKPNPFNLLAKALLYFYKYAISPLLPSSCRFIPSCSTYAVEAYQKHTFFYASFLVFKRLLSCHPFSKKEILDEVPERKRD